MYRQKVKTDAEVQLYMRTQKLEEEKRRAMKEEKEMLAYSVKEEQKLHEREAARKAQLKKIQQENLQVALMKKNTKVQGKVNESIKEQDLVDSDAFANKNAEVR